MFQHREDRKNKIDQLFRGNIELMDEDIESIMDKLEKTLLKENQIWWDVITMEKYLVDGIVPRGLRIKKICSFSPETAEFTKDWFRILDTCSSSLMGLILKEKRQVLRKLEGQIEEFSTLIEPFLEIQDVKEMEESIRHRVLKKEQGIIDKKSRKYKRDTMDYNAGIQYMRLEDKIEKKRKKEKGEKQQEVFPPSFLGSLEEVEEYLRQEEEKIEKRIQDISKEDRTYIKKDEAKNGVNKSTKEKKQGTKENKQEGKTEMKVSRNSIKSTQDGREREKEDRGRIHYNYNNSDRNEKSPVRSYKENGMRYDREEERQLEKRESKREGRTHQDEYQQGRAHQDKWRMGEKENHRWKETHRTPDKRRMSYDQEWTYAQHATRYGDERRDGYNSHQERIRQAYRDDYYGGRKQHNSHHYKERIISPYKDRGAAPDKRQHNSYEHREYREGRGEILSKEGSFLH